MVEAIKRELPPAGDRRAGVPDTATRSTRASASSSASTPTRTRRASSSNCTATTTRSSASRSGGCRRCAPAATAGAEAALGACVAAAATDINLMDPLLDCARADCTEGEIIAALQDGLRDLHRDAGLLTSPHGGVQRAARSRCVPLVAGVEAVRGCSRAPSDDVLRLDADDAGAELGGDPRIAAFSAATSPVGRRVRPAGVADSSPRASYASGTSTAGAATARPASSRTRSCPRRP